MRVITTNTGSGAIRPAGARRRRAAAMLAGTAMALATLAACGGGDEAEDPPQTGASAAEPAGYLAVPDGVELTEPGTELEVGETATIAWEPREGTTAVLDLTVDRIERTTFDDSFQGWQIDDRTAAMTPYFVRATAVNVSGADLGGVHVLIWAKDDNDTLVDTQRFQKKVFRPCPSGDLPKKFADGDSAQVCFVYLMSPGRALEAVAFPPPSGLEPVLWSGKISTKVKVPAPDTKGKKGKSGKSDEKGGSGKKSGDGATAPESTEPTEPTEPDEAAS